MKVLLALPPTNAGPETQMGSGVLLRQLAAQIAALGVEVETSFGPTLPAGDFDLVHLFDLHRPVQLHSILDQVPAGRPIVLTPLYHTNLFQYFWSKRAINGIFHRGLSRQDLDRHLGSLRDRSLVIKTEEGEMITATSVNRKPEAAFLLPRRALARVHHLLVNSFMEMQDLVRTLNVLPLPFTVFRLAVDGEEFEDADPDLFASRYGLRDFVVQVGHIFSRKNQLMLCHALRDLDLPLVLIGEVWERQYVELCRQHGPKRLLILPQLPRDEYRSALRAARVHVLPSWAECCGLVSMEAALADCNVVVSSAGHEMEYFGNLVYYCDPADAGSIRTAVLRAFERHEADAPRRLELRRLIQDNYTWPQAAEQVLAGYRQALASS